MSVASVLRVSAAVCLLWSGLLGQQATPSPEANVPSESLADIARKVRKDHTNEAKMTPEDAKEISRSVDKLFEFAVEDSGFPKKSAVKERMVSSADVEKYTREHMAKAEADQHFVVSEMTMKKFGLLPREFNLREFAAKANSQQIAGYYDEDTKSISLLNWVPLEQQKPVLAHELTHALQGQNFDLHKWAKAGMAKKSDSDYEADESVTARHAVVEGQAMVVFIDYILAPAGRTLLNTPGLVYQMQDSAVKAVIDSQMTHDAPMVLRETGVFPYRDGLIFENELLQKGGKHMAFAGAFARPPRSTHEVLQPKAYIENERLKVVKVPDVQALLAGKYEVYDSGDIGELDVRALLKQFGQRKDADTLAASWQGGAYVTFRKSEKPASGPASTADLALLYVSHWKTPQSAEKFARQYVGSVAQRYKKAVVQDVPVCVGVQCPVAAAQISTEEGPVIVEQWADSSVVVLESFDTAMAAKLRDAVRENAPGVQASSYRSDELSIRLYELPAFRKFQERLGASILEELSESVGAWPEVKK